MKRFVKTTLAAVLMACLVFCGIACAEGNDHRHIAQGGSDGIATVSDYFDLEEQYEAMVKVFQDNDLPAAWEIAEEIYEVNNLYQDIYRYHTYLRARLVLLPEKKYQEAYRSFSQLAGPRNPFADSEGYAAYAQGMMYKQEGDFENAEIKMREALDLGVSEAGPELSALPVSNKTISLFLKDSSVNSITIAVSDTGESGSYQVRYYPAGTELSAKTREMKAGVNTKLTDLLPDTSYTITVNKTGAPGNSVTETYATDMPGRVDYEKAHSVMIHLYRMDKDAVNRFGVIGTINSKQDKVIKLVEDGYSRTNRKPSETVDDFYARIRFSCDSSNKYTKDTSVPFTIVLRSGTSPVVAVGKTESVTMEKDKLNQSFYTGCLTDLMDLMYSSGGFDGDSFTIYVYMNNLLLGSQEIVINQR